MNRRWWVSVTLSALALLVSEGCRHQCRRPFAPTCPRCGPSNAACCPPAPGLLPPQPIAPAPPPPTVPVAPPIPAPAPPAPSPVDVRSFSAPAPDATWHGAPPNARLAVPETPPAAVTPRDSVRLQPPATAEPPRAEPTKPAVTEPRASLPVGIPQFAAAKDRVTAGLKPRLDGLEWLQANGYRTVLHIRGPRDLDNTDRQVVEKHGLKYLHIDLSPQNLAQSVDEFNRLLAETSLQPLFVYDRDGALAGSLWFLHFRTTEKLADDAARRRASGLGLKEDATGDAATLWLAVQEYLRKNPPTP